MRERRDVRSAWLCKIPTVHGTSDRPGKVDNCDLKFGVKKADVLALKHESRIAGMYLKSALSFWLVSGHRVASPPVLGSNTGLKMRNKKWEVLMDPSNAMSGNATDVLQRKDVYRKVAFRGKYYNVGVNYN